jgi:hypothetical protein
MKTKEELQLSITKRNAEMVKQCILVVETMPKEYILKEKRQVLFDIKTMEKRGKQFYKDELKDLRRKLKYLRFITTPVKAKNSRKRL